MTAAHAVSIAVTFTWLGMVVISFIEAPLKFPYARVTVRLVLEIGRLGFRALNVTEIVWAALLIAGLVAGDEVPFLRALRLLWSENR